MHTARRKTSAVVGILVAVALAVAGCGGDDDEPANTGAGNAAPDPNKQVTLNFETFGTMGFKEAGLFDDYKKVHPNVTIKYSSVEQEQQFWPALQQKLNAGKGTVDVAGIEGGRIAEVTQNQANKWTDLKQYGGGDLEKDYYPWKWQQGSTADGKLLGLGTDTGPLAVCYRTDLFQAAGLPTERTELEQAWSSWDAFIEMGKTYTQKTKKPFIDSAGGLYNAIIGSEEEQYYDANGELVYETNPKVKAAYDQAAAASQAGITAKLSQFTDAWNKSFASGGFATINCPAWMTGYIADQAGEAGKGKWGIAHAPTPGNWGGSWLGVPANSQNKEYAAQFIEWLLAPEQQVKLFVERASFPSSNTAAENPQVKSATNEYFSNAPVGEIFGDIAADLPVVRLGPKHGNVQTSITNGLLQVETQDKSPDDAWQETLKNIKNAVG